MIRRSQMAVATIAIVAAGCNTGAAEAEPFEGNWVSETWGMYLSIADGAAEVYEFTDAHCFAVGGGGVRGVADILTFDGETLVLDDADRTVRFDSIEFVPQRCIAPVVGDPESTFDVVVATMEAHHAPGLDSGWSARVSTERPSPDADDDAVFAAITRLLEPLAHTDIRLATADRDIWRGLESPEVELLPGDRSGLDGIVTGLLVDGVSYVGLERMGGFSDDDAVSGRELGAAIDAAAVAPAMVLDLRPADGGTVAHAMIVLSRFVTEEVAVAHFEAMGPNGVEAAGTVTASPLQIGTYAGPVYVLTGPGTSGPAELLVAGLSQLDQVTVIGADTAGAPGPRMVRQLPNGWVMGLANLMVRDPSGNDLSGGISPDVPTSDPFAIVLELLEG